MYYFIVNPLSNNGRGERIWKKLEKLLKDWKVEYQCFVTEKPGDAKKFARLLTEGIKEPRTITAVGGDGTVNEILDGLLFGGPVNFGYIPTGTGNDLARSLRFPRNPRKCLKRILFSADCRQMDYGVLSYGEDAVFHRRFCVSAGIGMDAAVCHNLLFSRKNKNFCGKRMGKFSYLLIGIKQLILAKPVRGYLILDGVKKVEFNHIYFAAFHIHPYEGGGFRFAPQANPFDGKLSVCVASHSSKRKLIPVLLSTYFGIRKKKHMKGIRTYECREARLHTERPMAVHTDGESCFCQDDLQVQCIERQLRIIV